MKKVKMTKKLYRVLQAYMKLYSRIEDRFNKEIDVLEKIMQKETKIEDIIFFMNKNKSCGIGSVKQGIGVDRYKLEK